MKMKRSTQPEAADSRKARQVPKRDYGQAKGGWTPFGPPAGQQDIPDVLDYEAFDTDKQRWYNYRGKQR